MTAAAELWLAIACNPLRSEIDRRISWDTYEKERWLEAVTRGDLRICELEPRLQTSVYAAIVDRRARLLS